MEKEVTTGESNENLLLKLAILAFPAAVLTDRSIATKPPIDLKSAASGGVPHRTKVVEIHWEHPH
jgi:hypothetical protein